MGVYPAMGNSGRQFIVAGLAGLVGFSCLASVPPSSTSTQTPPIPPQAQAAVRLAVADLSRRLGIPEAQIRVEAVEAVDWPDTSLGCPKPGLVYAQVITPGFRVILANGGPHEYHTDLGGQAVSCP